MIKLQLGTNVRINGYTYTVYQISLDGLVIFKTENENAFVKEVSLKVLEPLTP